MVGIDYLDINSANFPGLLALEGLIKKIGPPQWPWTVNNTLANRGQAVFNRRPRRAAVPTATASSPASPARSTRRPGSRRF